MIKFALRRLTSLSLAACLTISLCGCRGDSKDNNNNDNTNDFALEEPKEISPSSALDSSIVLASLTPEDKPFRLKESFLDENNNLIYQEFGPEFYEKEINGLKYLINAETKKICISGYSNLGRLCCLNCLKKENGGTDSDLGYSGYVLLAIYNIDGENLFNLYDFDDFTPLLDKCDLSKSTSFNNDIFTLYYLASYDPKYRGHDDENAFTGWFFEVVKDDICYFVDVNDFNKIILSGDFNFYNENISATGNATVSYYDYSTHEDVLFRSEDLIPTYSDVLQRTLSPKNDN